MKAEVIPAVEMYYRALDSFSSKDGLGEIEWQRSRTGTEFDEEEFLCEAAWVILNSGFREATIRSKFDYISLCFLDWSSAEEIVAVKDQCIASASLEFNHYRKLSAIGQVAEAVSDYGISEVKRAVLADPIGELRKLPYIGPVTVWHLAKNLGFDVSKPDRHLVRLASVYGFDCVHCFCRTIAEYTGERVAVVDLVLWRYTIGRPT